MAAVPDCGKPAGPGRGSVRVFRLEREGVIAAFAPDGRQVEVDRETAGGPFNPRNTLPAWQASTSDQRPGFPKHCVVTPRQSDTARNAPLSLFSAVENDACQHSPFSVFTSCTRTDGESASGITGRPSDGPDAFRGSAFKRGCGSSLDARALLRPATPPPDRC